MTLLHSILFVMARPRSAYAALLLADAIVDSVEDLSALRARLARRALAGDLDDSLQHLIALKRSMARSGS